MRDIRFRGKRADNGEWYYGNFYESGISGCYILENATTAKKGRGGAVEVYDKFDVHEVDPATIGQFTGLKDKNGREIYEGDIISLCDDTGTTIKVVCEFGNARRDIYGNTVDILGFYYRRLIDGKKTFPIVENYAGKHDLELFEVIGNVHDTPELLEVSQ